jgi:hypothetical protein
MPRVTSPTPSSRRRKRKRASEIERDSSLFVDIHLLIPSGIPEHIVLPDQIPEVNNFINAKVATRVHDIRKWLFSSALACSIGLSLVVAGHKGLIFSSQQYTYYSPGVILPGEPTNIFSMNNQLVSARADAGEITAEERNKQKIAFATTRVREDYLLADNYRGEAFSVEVDGGSRTYEMKQTWRPERFENRWLMLLGVLLAFGGLFGFLVEFRLRSVKPL